MTKKMTSIRIPRFRQAFTGLLQVNSSSAEAAKVVHIFRGHFENKDFENGEQVITAYDAAVEEYSRNAPNVQVLPILRSSRKTVLKGLTKDTPLQRQINSLLGE